MLVNGNPAESTLGELLDVVSLKRGQREDACGVYVALTIEYGQCYAVKWRNRTSYFLSLLFLLILSFLLLSSVPLAAAARHHGIRSEIDKTFLETE